MTIEVEKRAILTKQQYTELSTFLHEVATDKGENNMESVFYVRTGAQIKVQRNTSAHTAKIAWKSGGIDGSEKRTEIELPVSYDDFDTANDIIAAIADDAQIIPTTQRRHDYQLDNIEIALKHSDDWGYHIELEIVVEDEANVRNALERIHTLADKLQVHLLSEAEEKDFVTARIAARSQS